MSNLSEVPNNIANLKAKIADLKFQQSAMAAHLQIFESIITNQNIADAATSRAAIQEELKEAKNQLLSLTSPQSH